MSDPATRVEDAEDTTVGGVTWHSSGPDEGPDVGISIYISPTEQLWCGELSDRCFSDLGGSEHFDNSFGWFIVHYSDDTSSLIGKCADRHQAREIFERAASWLRAASELTALRAEVERMREALKPFAIVANQFDASTERARERALPDAYPIGSGLTLGQCRGAREPVSNSSEPSALSPGGAV